MPNWTQDNRLLKLDTPLGKDVLLLSAFSGTETISRLFSYQLEMFSTRESISAKEIVGKNVTWCVQRFDDAPRYFNGFVSRFSGGGMSIQDLRSYRMEVIPWLWFLTRTSNCRIFQHMKAPDIIEKIFKDYGFSDYKMDLDRSYPELEYCVQYRETAFNYVSHLMEQYGIFYFFQHENGKHTMVISDHKGSYKDVKENKVTYTLGDIKPNQLTRWDHQYEFRPGKWAHTDYNFETPNTDLLTKTNTKVKLPGVDKYEMFDYPGDYLVKPVGEADVKAHMEEDETPYDVVNAASECCTFNPGGKFKIDDHDLLEEKGKGYVITSINHVASSTSLGTSADKEYYSNTFTVIPDDVTFRPPRITPKPTIIGPQPAVVVGPKGEEIYTDKYGRVKVQFFWDREGKRDENSSCWIRVSQPMAGRRWGTSFWPRIGQEVLVNFHEGDPDRPIIGGVVYNADQMPPYQGDGPDEKHKNDNKVSGYKSNTTLGGVGFNEWRFDDTKGKEQIFMHAERNMDVRVKHDSMERVIHDRHLIVGAEKEGKKDGDQREMVYQDKHLNVHRDQVEQIEGNYLLTVGKGDAKNGGNMDIVIEKDKKELIEKNSHLHIKAARNEKIDGTQSLIVGVDQQEKVGQNHALDAGQEIHLKAGMKVIIEAGIQLTIKGAGGFVDIGPAGVTIQGTMVKINSGGSPGSGSGSNPTEAEDAKKAEPIEPTIADDSKTGKKSAP